MGLRSRWVRASFPFVAYVVAGLVGPAVVADGMKVVSYEQARFVPVDPKRPEGPSIAVLHGDPDTGPSSLLIKMPKGAGPLHTHTADYDLVVIEGRMRHWGRGQKEADTPELGPGSYWHQPGREAHADSCLTEVCVMYVKFAGKRDGALAPEPSTR